jgi:hypothetical protein
VSTLGFVVVFWKGFEGARPALGFVDQMFVLIRIEGLNVWETGNARTTVTRVQGLVFTVHSLVESVIARSTRQPNPDVQNTPEISDSDDSWGWFQRLVGCARGPELREII